MASDALILSSSYNSDLRHGRSYDAIFAVLKASDQKMLYTNGELASAALSVACRSYIVPLTVHDGTSTVEAIKKKFEKNSKRVLKLQEMDNIHQFMHPQMTAVAREFLNLWVDHCYSKRLIHVHSLFIGKGNPFDQEDTFEDQNDSGDRDEDDEKKIMLEEPLTIENEAVKLKDVDLKSIPVFDYRLAPVLRLLEQTNLIIDIKNPKNLDTNLKDQLHARWCDIRQTIMTWNNCFLEICSLHRHTLFLIENPSYIEFHIMAAQAMYIAWIYPLPNINVKELVTLMHSPVQGSPEVHLSLPVSQAVEDYPFIGTAKAYEEILSYHTLESQEAILKFQKKYIRKVKESDFGPLLTRKLRNVSTVTGDSVNRSTSFNRELKAFFDERNLVKRMNAEDKVTFYKRMNFFMKTCRAMNATIGSHWWCLEFELKFGWDEPLCALALYLHILSLINAEETYAEQANLVYLCAVSRIKLPTVFSKIECAKFLFDDFEENYSHIKLSAVTTTILKKTQAVDITALRAYALSTAPASDVVADVLASDIFETSLPLHLCLHSHDFYNLDMEDLVELDPARIIWFWSKMYSDIPPLEMRRMENRLHLFTDDLFVRTLFVDKTIIFCFIVYIYLNHFGTGNQIKDFVKTCPFQITRDGIPLPK